MMMYSDTNVLSEFYPALVLYIPYFILYYFYSFDLSVPELRIFVVRIRSATDYWNHILRFCCLNFVISFIAAVTKVPVAEAFISGLYLLKLVHGALEGIIWAIYIFFKMSLLFSVLILLIEAASLKLASTHRMHVQRFTTTEKLSVGYTFGLIAAYLITPLGTCSWAIQENLLDTFSVQDALGWKWGGTMRLLLPTPLFGLMIGLFLGYFFHLISMGMYMKGRDLFKNFPVFVFVVACLTISGVFIFYTPNPGVFPVHIFKQMKSEGHYFLVLPYIIITTLFVYVGARWFGNICFEGRSLTRKIFFGSVARPFVEENAAPEQEPLRRDRGNPSEPEIISLRQKLLAIDEYLRGIERDSTNFIVTVAGTVLSVVGGVALQFSALTESSMKMLLKIYRDLFPHGGAFLNFIFPIFLFGVMSVAIIMFTSLKFFLATRAYTYRQLQFTASVLEQQLGINRFLPSSWNSAEKNFSMFDFMPETIKIYYAFVGMTELLFYTLSGIIMFFVLSARHAPIKSHVDMVLQLGLLVVVSTALSVFIAAYYKIKINNLIGSNRRSWLCSP